MTKIHIEVDDVSIDLTPEQARKVYDELSRLFLSPSTTIASMWDSRSMIPSATVASTKTLTGTEFTFI